MKIKSRMTIGVVISSLILASCQSTPKNTVIDKKAYIAPKVLIEPHKDTDNDGVPDIIDNCPNTPKGVVADEYGCPVAVSLIGYLTMELRVFFERNSNELQTKYLPEVEKVAEKMLNNRNIKTNTGIKISAKLDDIRNNLNFTIKENDEGIHPGKPVFQERLRWKPSDPVFYRVLADRVPVPGAVGPLPVR